MKKQTKIMFINSSTPTPNNTATIANSSSSSSFVTFFENVQASSSITGDSTNDFDQSNIAEAFLNKREHLPKTNCAAVNQFFSVYIRNRLRYCKNKSYIFDWLIHAKCVVSILKSWRSLVKLHEKDVSQNTYSKETNLSKQLDVICW